MKDTLTPESLDLPDRALIRGMIRSVTVGLAVWTLILVLIFQH